MNTIIAIGSDELREVRQAIRKEVSQRFEANRCRASIWRRIVIWVELELKVRAELRRRYPPHLLRSHSP
jgi:hypothetical protein